MKNTKKQLLFDNSFLNYVKEIMIQNFSTHFFATFLSFVFKVE